MTSNGLLKGQKALVTGASSGIGEAVARALAAAGAVTVVNYRAHAAPAERIASEIRSAGGEAIALRADVSREDEVETMFATTFERLGTIDILINNAGIQRDAAITDMTLREWQAVIDVNLTGQFLCARAAVREFRRRGLVPEISRSTGKIICISSVHEVVPWAFHANYAASKGGLALLMRSLAQEVARDRIRVNSIAPGAIRTAINRQAWETPQAEADLLRLIPYGRVGDPADVAKAAVWLASDESDYVTGATLFVDGGMLLYPAFYGGG